jgi:hypothetical protein
MNKYESMIEKTEDRIIRHLWWLIVLLVSAAFAGCGSGSGKPILGGVQVGGFAIITAASSVVVDGAPVVINAPAVPVVISGASSVVVVGPPGVVTPGAICPVSASTIPTVTLTDPINGNQFVTTGTNGAGKTITATFSLPMDPSTINVASFTLAPVGGSALIPAVVGYNAATSIATLTTSAPLQTKTSYTANITTAATSTLGVTMSCSEVWSFTTGTVTSVNLGSIATFAIASAAGLTNTPTAPLTHINGDVVLDPLATCNAVAVDAAGGFGLCNGMAPTLTGKVISPLFNTGVTSASIMADLKTAYTSITPANLPGATVLGCGTIGTNGAAGVGIGCAGNATLPPGIYISATNSSIGVTGVLTLDGQGDSNSSFVFQAASTLTTAAGASGAPGSQIVLINGAKASNVWWQVGSSATIGTYSVFNGNVLADTSITMVVGSTSCGRMLAGAITTSGAFTFDSNVVSVPGNASAPAGCQ